MSLTKFVEKHDPHHIIIGVFANFPQNKHQFKNDDGIHKFFYERRKKYSVLKDFKFEKNWDGPYSDTLHEVLYGLTASRMLRSWGPDFDPYDFVPRLNKVFKERYESAFNEKERDELKSLSQEFYQQFGLK